MHNNPDLGLFKPSKTSSVSLPSDSLFYRQWGLDTSLLSQVEADTTKDFVDVKAALKDHLKIENPSDDECQAVKILVHAIGKRAARLSAVPIAAILIHTGKLETENMVDVGVDGSLVEFYPKFEEYIREALREVSQVGVAGDKKVRIGISKDGSGVGAALIALVASKDGNLQSPNGNAK
jgi:hexokinase